MGLTHPFRLRALVLALLLSLVAALLLAIQLPTPAFADSAPQNGAPATVTTDALPTVQINGVVWSQVIVGNTVYVGGEFTQAQPAGAAAGVNTVARSNLLAYNLSTGELIASFAPTVNGAVNSVAASPDGSVVYIGGSFTSVNGLNRYRIAAFNTATGALTSFAPAANSTVEVVAANSTTVYFGGNFTAVGTATRNRIAAVKATNGALLPFNADAEGGRVKAIVISPDGTKIVVGGAFTSLDGSSNPGYGLGALDAVTGAIMPWAANTTYVRDAGANSSIESLTSDGDSVYGTGYVFGSGGTLEGAFRANWSDGSIVWVEDCHGDTYSGTITGGVFYTASHAHYCGNSGGFPQSSPTWTMQRGMAWSKEPSSHLITPDPYGYFSFTGLQSPQLLNFWPDINVGTYTGQSQGAWSVTSNANYVLYGGEFTKINGVRQQGLVRFAVSSIAPDKDGPRLAGADFVPSAVSLAPGSVRLSWLANYDRDNQYLTYDLYRNGVLTTPIYETVQGSRIWWDRPQMGYVDTGLTPGGTYTYLLKATDPFGNVSWGLPVTVTVTTATMSPYASGVIASGATDFWRLGESTGPTVYDWAGYNDAAASSGVTLGAIGAISNDPNTAATFSGDSTGLVATQSLIAGPNTFAIEAWFKTTSTSGGKIVGFGNANTGNSSNYDRHVYLDGAGRVYFGVYPGSSVTLQSDSGYNDGKWHYVVAQLSSSGMQLYLDGSKVAQRSDTTSAQAYSGYWRIGGDSTWAGSPYFAGQIDDVAIYSQPLSNQTVNQHWMLSGRPSTIPSAPADAYGAQVFADSPELYWRLADTTGSTAADSGPNGSPGTYSGGVTKGVAGALAASTNTAAAFDGSTGFVASNRQFSNPQTYSLEAWFKTTTVVGGKIIGFGDSNSGQSSSYDRHIYMNNSGQLVFGTYTGQTNTITTPASYNNGTWHYVVATQASDGLKLYVDGQLVGTNATTQAQNYDGYWRVGGDQTWGSSSNFFNGSIDEVAVYGTELSSSSISQHFAIGTAAMTPPPAPPAPPVNVAPVASFSSSVNGLAAAVDASTSSDSDGTIASYAWSFGDNSTASGVTSTHSYATAGSYPVSLTVTDNSGATTTTTQTVTVTQPATPPATLPVAPLAADTFSRTIVSGLGTADAGGAWTLSGGATNFSVNGSTASLTNAKAGSTVEGYLNTLSSTNTDVTVTVSLAQLPTGAGDYVSVIGRKTSTSDYRARALVNSAGGVTLQLLQGGTTLQAATVAGLTYTPGTQLQIHFQVFGTTPTTLRANLWKTGTPEPAGWQVSRTDSTTTLQTTGSIGIGAYLSGSSTITPFTTTFDNLLVGKAQ